MLCQIAAPLSTFASVEFVTFPLDELMILVYNTNVISENTKLISREDISNHESDSFQQQSFPIDPLSCLQLLRGARGRWLYIDRHRDERPGTSDHAGGQQAGSPDCTHPVDPCPR